MIELINISKKFGDKEIFNNFSLTVNDGESIVITGKSGSGKSTLLNILSLIEKVDSGNIVWNNTIINKINSKETELLMRNEIGYLFQNYALIENDSVLDNLKLASMYAKNRKNIDYHKLLSEMDLDIDINKKIYLLSGGEQQRVALARLFIKPCKIIFADEPTGNLDQKNSDKIMDKLFELNKKGKTLVVVTHDLSIVDRFDRHIKLEN